MLQYSDIHSPLILITGETGKRVVCPWQIPLLHPIDIDETTQMPLLKYVLEDTAREFKYDEIK